MNHRLVTVIVVAFVVVASAEIAAAFILLLRLVEWLMTL